MWINTILTKYMSPDTLFIHEPGLNEESETENVEPTTSKLNNQDIESDEEMNDTMILRPQLRH
jgi:hypothetical protein